ncbi:MAG: hypothetical protein JHC33_09120 [Ignisphaera sp.]|nr:hypothetical protein [Ignisphaera sp.]
MVVIYENQDKSISVLIPTQEALSFATIQEIAEKDVPHNLPYWIVDEITLPAEPIELWQLDGTQGDPDGFGGESNEFDAELLAKYKQGVIG